MPYSCTSAWRTARIIAAKKTVNTSRIPLPKSAEKSLINHSIRQTVKSTQQKDYKNFFTKEFNKNDKTSPVCSLIM